MTVWSNSFLTLVCAASLMFSFPVGGVHKENLEAKVGENITMQPWTDDLRGDYRIVVSLVSGDTEVTLFDCDKGQIDIEPPKELAGKLSLNTKTASLTFGLLSLSDSGVYKVQITDGDSTVHTYIYKLDVSDQVQNPVTAVPSRNTTDELPKVQRNQIAAIATGSIIGIVCIVGLSAIGYKAFIFIKAKMEEKKKGKIQSTEMSVI